MTKKKEEKNSKKDKQHGREKTRKGNRPNDHRWVRWGIILLLSLVMVFLSLFFIPGELHYQITETYLFSADQPAEVYLYLLLPTTGPYQQVFDPVIHWPGTQESQNEGRLNILKMSSEVEVGQPVKAVINYRVFLLLGETSWGDEQAGEPVVDLQSTHPEIAAQAEKLQVEGNQFRSAEKNFAFAMHHQDWPGETFIAEDVSALAVYHTGMGESMIQAHLLAGLNETVGIPSRVVGGLVMPEFFPNVPNAATWQHPAVSSAWVELFVDGVWINANPSQSGKFLHRDLFGWMDGKHLVYDEITRESELYTRLLAEAAESGLVIASSPEPLRFIAWSDVDDASVEVTPKVTIRKVWDPRLLMVFSVVVILVVINWLYESDERRLNFHRKD